MPLEEYENWQPKTLAERVAHNRLTNATGMDELALKATKEITDNTLLIEKVTGVKVRFMRPPYGSHTKATDAVAKKLGQAVVNWSAGALDWQYNTAAKVVAATMPQLAPGAIVLAHDIHPWTIKAVPTLIKKIRAKGYTLVSLDDILGPTTPGKTYTRGLRP